MTSVIIIAIALVLFIPITIFAYDNEPTCEAGYELISGNTECTLFNFEVEGIPSICADIKGPQIDPKMQGDTGLTNPQYMKAYREAQNQYHQQMQECIRNNQVLSFSDDMGMLFEKSNTLANQKKYVESLKELDKVLELTDNEVIQGKVFLAKAVIYFNLDEYETAIQYYDKVLEIEPRHSQALLHKGILYQEIKQWQNSIDMFEQVLDYPGEDVASYIEYSQDKLDRAEKSFFYESEKIIPITNSKIICGIGTVDVDGQCVVDTSKSSKGGGCLIATATYGSELAPQVQQLRELRDNQLLNTESGTAFMSTFNDIYYSFSPTIADMEREHPLFKEAVKLAITPMISTLSLMENANSESEVLSIGISVIMLNLGMYLGVPAVVIVGIRKKF